MIGVNFKHTTNLFFDSDFIVARTDRATRKVLSKFGAYVRRTAKSSIRTRKRVSSPGSPPTSRTGILKRFLFFAYDQSKQSVVIGPAKANQLSFNSHGHVTKGAVPEVLEHGGDIYVHEIFKHGTWQRMDLRRRENLPQRKRKVSIEARPFMGPAMAKESPKLPDMWKDSIK